MQQITLEVTPKLQEQIALWSPQMEGSVEDLALRLLEDYFEDIEDYYEAARVSAEIKAGRMETYTLEEVKAHLGLAG